MKRRASLWMTLLLAVGLAFGTSIEESCSRLFQFTPRLYPLQNETGTPDLLPMPLCYGFKLEEATIDDMQEAMENGRLSSVKLVLCYMTRTIQTQPYINSVMQVNPDALAIAAQRDAERRKGIVHSRLHGVPFTVKDSFATDDNMDTTAGCWPLMGSRGPEAEAVRRLRKAGAVLFGKAAMSEWADMRSSDYSEGYSARGGQCRSAYNLTVNPGGSSSGSAVGVGANVIAFSLGTETDGSVINPAMRNSIVGFKPTVGLTSRAGVIPETEHQDSVGSFGRTVADAVYAFDAIYGIDKNDNYTLAQKGNTPKGGYTQFLANRDAFKKRRPRFGIPRMSLWRYADPEQLRVLDAMVKHIKKAGAKIIEGAEITNYERLVSPDGWNWDLGTTKWNRSNESEYTYVKVDFYNNINAYLSRLNNTNITTFAEIVQYNRRYAGTEGGYPWPKGHPAFKSGQDGFLASLATHGIQNETYFQALSFCQSSNRRGIDEALRLHLDKSEWLDGLLVPVSPGQSYQLAAQAGYPMITIPAGVRSDSGMGFGLGIMQTAWQEEKLIRWGSAIEDLCRDTKFRRSRPRWLGYLERNMPVPLV